MGLRRHFQIRRAWFFPSSEIALEVDQRIINDTDLRAELNRGCWYMSSSALLDRRGLLIWIGCSDVPRGALKMVERLAQENGGEPVTGETLQVAVEKAFQAVWEQRAIKPHGTVERWFPRRYG